MTVCDEGRTDGRTNDEEGLGNINGATATKNDDDVQTTEIGRLGEGGATRLTVDQGRR